MPTLKKMDIIRKSLSSIEDTIRSAYVKIKTKKYYVNKSTLYTSPDFTKIAGHFQNGMAMLRSSRKSSRSRTMRTKKNSSNKLLNGSNNRLSIVTNGSRTIANNLNKNLSRTNVSRTNASRTNASKNNANKVTVEPESPVGSIQSEDGSDTESVDTPMNESSSNESSGSPVESQESGTPESVMSQPEQVEPEGTVAEESRT